MICPHCEREVRPVHFYRSGKARCQNNRVWTPAKRWKLMEGIEQGWSDRRIGARLGVSADAVQVARKRYGIPSRTKTALNCRTTAKLLGFGCGKKVARLIERGWLKGRRSQPRGGNTQWLVRRNDLMTFLDNPAYFHLWDPVTIADPFLRHWAMKRRGDVRFLTLSEVAERLCVDVQTPHQWIKKGFLPGVRTGMTKGNHLIRESDLASFELPRIGPRPKPRKAA